jgi:hypothetical protein
MTLHRFFLFGGHSLLNKTARNTCGTYRIQQNLTKIPLKNKRGMEQYLKTPEQSGVGQRMRVRRPELTASSMDLSISHTGDVNEIRSGEVEFLKLT